jgi:hypothetical protein
LISSGTCGGSWRTRRFDLQPYRFFAIDEIVVDANSVPQLVLVVGKCPVIYQPEDSAFAELGHARGVV